jgi:hypothetical protein
MAAVAEPASGLRRLSATHLKLYQRQEDSQHGKPFHP